MKPANDNTRAPILELVAAGDGCALARVLARVLVRRELVLANAIPDDVQRENERVAG